ncbi:MAG: hypothetical protein F6K40_14705 [Okeania sp. SIO3I5]|uniref:hypothetical protein n=1 Tax=Okeania sp. SIO3I5 TaxID=2607805 RepID=UPI0013BA2A72|nr:hypothetical protein [Okeania sp. SIO3I5]NEQ37447.1 hypothetical protein [Okeania sp. SIO3I5]
MEIVEGARQENESSPQLEPPSFEESYRESQNYENQVFSREDEALITPELKLDASENRENLDNTESLESLSNLFGKLEVDKGGTEQLITTNENQQNSTNLTVKVESDLTEESEEKTYIQAPITQSLLPVEEFDEKPDELLLDSQTLQHLRSDLESLEEIDVDELIDDPGQTQLQLGEEYQDIDSTENTPDLLESGFAITSEEEVTNLENLFVNVDDVSERTIASNQENISSSVKSTDNELTLEDILDDLTPATEDEEELRETENREFLALESLLQDESNSEKKI